MKKETEFLHRLADAKFLEAINDHIKSGAINNWSKYSSFANKLDLFHSVKLSCNGESYQINFCHKKKVIASCKSHRWNKTLTYCIYENDKFIRQGLVTREQFYDFLRDNKQFADWLIWNQI